MELRKLFYIMKSREIHSYPRDKLEEFQLERLDHVLKKASQTPFYLNRWDSNPVNIQDFKQLPIIESKNICGEEIFRQTLDKEQFKTRESSGTSRRIEVAFSDQANDWISATQLKSMYLHGYRPRMKIAKYWFEELERSWIAENLVPIRFIKPGFSLKEQIDILEDYDPDVIDYFPRILMTLSKYLNNEDLNHEINPEFILTRGEILTESMKKYIQETFNAPVHNQYGSTEFGLIGSECPEGGFHINEDLVFYEVLNRNGDTVDEGEVGRMVLTGLINEVTPLIRYDIGDVVEKASSNCECDTSFGKINRIYGRKKDVFKKSEREIYPYEIMDLISPCEEILSYQFRKSDESYVLDYVKNRNPDENKITAIFEKLKSHLGFKNLKINEIEDIPVSSRGKIKLVDY